MFGGGSFLDGPGLRKSSDFDVALVPFVFAATAKAAKLRPAYHARELASEFAE